MNIINIHEKTYEQMMSCIAEFEQEIRALCSNSTTLADWLDNQQVCKLLHISKRTLQYYRDNGTLPYSQIGHKCYYKSTDVEALIRQSTIKKV